MSTARLLSLAGVRLKVLLNGQKTSLDFDFYGGSGGSPTAAPLPATLRARFLRSLTWINASYLPKAK